MIGLEIRLLPILSGKASLEIWLQWLKIDVFMTFEHRIIFIAFPNCQVGFATAKYARPGARLVWITVWNAWMKSNEIYAWWKNKMFEWKNEIYAWK